MTRFLSILMLVAAAVTVRADDIYLLISETNQAPIHVFPGLRMVVLRGSTASDPNFRPSGVGKLNNSEHWYFERGGIEVSSFPSLVDLDSKCVVPWTTPEASTNALAVAIAASEHGKAQAALKAALKGKDEATAQADIRAAIQSANSVPALRDALLQLADLLVAKDSMMAVEKKKNGAGK